MSLARALLALACALPLIASNTLVKDDKCVSKEKFFIMGVTFPTILTSVIIKPGIRNAVEYIPDNCALGGHHISSVNITVCDYDVVPELELDHYPHIKVTRKGMLFTEAIVMGKQYCTIY